MKHLILIFSLLFTIVFAYNNSKSDRIQQIIDTFKSNDFNYNCAIEHEDYIRMQIKKNKSNDDIIFMVKNSITKAKYNNISCNPYHR